MAEHVVWLILLASKLAHPLGVWSFLQRFHKLICNGDGNVEISYVPFFFLGVDKIKDIGMIHPHHCHIRSMPALLFYSCKRGIVYLEKRYGTRCLAP